MHEQIFLKDERKDDELMNKCRNILSYINKCRNVLSYINEWTIIFKWTKKERKINK